jgi:hypothetical protein
MRLELVLVMLSVIAPPPSALPSPRVFQSLFAVPPPHQPAALPVIRSVRNLEPPRTVCGMTILRPGATFESRIPVLPASPDRTYALRVEAPPVCSGRVPRSR